MLNRRILRIKAMQALYGFYTTRKSLVRVKRDVLEQKFTPDPLIHDLSDTSELDQNRRVSLRLYDEHLAKGKIDTSEKIDDEIFDAVSEAIDSYYRDTQSELHRTKRSMLKDTRDLQTLYYKFLRLPGEFQFLEKQDKDKRELAHIPKNDPWQFNLQSNPVIEAIDTSPDLQRAITEHRINWDTDHEKLRSWYKSVFKKDERVMAYQGVSDPSIEDHVSVLKHFFKNLIFKNETISDHFEETYLNWSEDSTILKSMLTRTIQEYTDENQQLTLKTISLNEEDDFNFFETIFDATIKEDARLEKLISEKTRNWEVNRLAKTDQIILKMALAEMIHCRSIPTKVTINEYIEICKQYSTPKSKQFVNGILDVLANQLTSEGVIKKSGRGLIDNR